MGKTRVRGLLCGIDCVILRLAILVEHRLGTDGWTHDDSIYRDSIALRSKNHMVNIKVLINQSKAIITNP